MIKNNNKSINVLDENATWILENKELFKDLLPGKIYTVFENEAPILFVKNTKFKYKSIYHKINGKVTIKTTKRISEKGNFFIKKISICKCGNLKAANKMRNPDCLDCLACQRNKKMLSRYRAKKKQKPDYTTNKNKKNKTSIIKSKKLKIKDIVFSITGYYKKVEDKIFSPETVNDIFENMWRERINKFNIQKEGK